VLLRDFLFYVPGVLLFSLKVLIELYVFQLFQNNISGILLFSLEVPIELYMFQLVKNNVSWSSVVFI
jgi:hypothetical protein